VSRWSTRIGDGISDPVCSLLSVLGEQHNTCEDWGFDAKCLSRGADTLPDTHSFHTAPFATFWICRFSLWMQPQPSAWRNQTWYT